MSNKKIIKNILAFTSKQKKYILSSIIFAFTSVLIAISQPILIGKILDNIVGVDNVDFVGILQLLIPFSVIIIFGFLSQWLMSFCTNKLAFLTIRDLRNSVFDKYNDISIGYIDSHSHGDMVSKVGIDMEKISEGLLQGFTQLFSGIITILITLAFMIYLNLYIAVVVIVLTPLSVLLASFIAKSVHKQFTLEAKLNGEISGYISEQIDGLKTTKTFCKESQSIANFSKINKDIYVVGVKSQFYSAMTNPCTRFINNLVYATVGVVGAILCISTNDLFFGKLAIKTMTTGQLTTFLMYSNQYTKPFNEISGVIGQLQSALASAKRVFEFLEEPIESDSRNSKKLDTCSGEVSFENVDFSYVDSQPLIQNFNLCAKPGQKIAIVGPTGCGKTTLINLLMRFYDLKSGAIKVENIDICDITKKDLRSCYGMVLQDTWLFEGTIAQNICFGKQNASLQEIIEASKLANIDFFISKLSQGYDTMVFGNGDNLSQGQRQLLCIARIMLLKPPMLILDEATSNIDTRTEQKISQAFEILQKDKTSFIVAHRLSTIKNADVILVMKDGNIIEQGCHTQLLELDGFYKKLYQSQYEQK